MRYANTLNIIRLRSPLTFPILLALYESKEKKFFPSVLKIRVWVADLVEMVVSSSRRLEIPTLRKPFVIDRRW